MPKYEIRIVYRGANTYFVEAENQESAMEKAKARYNNGETGEETGSEFEEIEHTYDNSDQ